MEDVAAKTLPQGYAGEWTDTAFQEKRAEGKTGIILGFAVLFAYLFSGRALRELDNSGAGPAFGLGRNPRVVHRDRARSADARSLCADRYRRIDRPGSQERHPDHRVREGEERSRDAIARRSDRGCETAIPPGDDDVVRLHPRALSSGGRDRGLAIGSSRRRHAGVWRHDLRLVHRDIHDPATLCGVSGNPREAQAVDETKGARRVDGVEFYLLHA